MATAATFCDTDTLGHRKAPSLRLRLMRCMQNTQPMATLSRSGAGGRNFAIMVGLGALVGGILIQLLATRLCFLQWRWSLLFLACTSGASRATFCKKYAFSVAGKNSLPDWLVDEDELEKREEERRRKER